MNKEALKKKAPRKEKVRVFFDIDLVYENEVGREYLLKSLSEAVFYINLIGFGIDSGPYEMKNPRNFKVLNEKISK